MGQYPGTWVRIPVIRRLGKSGSYYSDLIYKSSHSKSKTKIDVYKLPPISKIKFRQITWVDTDKCDDGKPFGSVLKLSKYRYRLPDIYGRQCYFWCDFNNKQYTPQVTENCQWCLLNSFGYLILYDAKTKEAEVFAIYFDTMRDVAISRYFYIDKNYNIHLAEMVIDEDDKSQGSPDIDRYLIAILNGGQMVIKNTK